MADIYNYRVDAWQRRFMGELFNAVFSLRGRVNFTNLARFSRLHEQTFLAIWGRLRHFKKAFQWVWFNLIVFRLRRHPEEPTGGAFNCTFLPKSGTETWGLGQFFSSLAGKPKKGLEMSALGIVATSSGRAFGVDAAQTPSDLPTGDLSTREEEEYSRVNFYLVQIIDLYDQLDDLGVSYWCRQPSAGFYAKQKVFDTADGLGGNLTCPSPLGCKPALPPSDSYTPVRQRTDPADRNSTTAKSTGATTRSLSSGSMRSVVFRISLKCEF